MRSRIFEAFVEHERHHPVTHRLRYPLHVYALELDELPELGRRLPLFGYNRLRPVALHDRDYLDPGPEPLPRKLARRLAAAGLPPDPARVVLVTVPRWFHYVFNPVSFYFCYDAAGALAAALAEVNNTFGERHVYVLRNGHPPSFPARFRAPKQFHVSPFNDLQGEYLFQLADIRQALDITIVLQREGRDILTARLQGAPVPLTARSQLALLLRHPLRAHLTIPRIYREAWRLYFRRRLAYHDKPVAAHPMTIRRPTATPLQRRGGKLILDLLARAPHGHLALTLPDGRQRLCGRPGALPAAVLQVHDHRFFTRCLLHGDIGFGEAFMDREWDSPDPTAVVRFFIRNREVFDDGSFRSTLLSRLTNLLRHLANANTPWGSRRNIRRHYDLSNAFFATFLDPTMAYSCALFATPGEDLETAQRRKFHRLMDLARLGPDDHVLEIGCGWGGFALEAVRQTGCRVTGITISRQQYDLARARVREAGLEGRIAIRLADYRQVRGRFDKIVSIEMLEAVGHRYFGAFFRACERLLEPDGLMALQVITIPDQRYPRYRRECDWIQKHIFPGGLLPSLTELARTMTRHSRLMVESAVNIGDHYALTLATWRERFLAREAEVAALGFDHTFRRKWLYYLAACEAGFRERVLGDLQLLLTREGNHRLSATLLEAPSAPAP